MIFRLIFVYPHLKLIRPYLTSNSRAALRRLVTSALDDQELDTLCYDFFPEVYESFGSSQGRAAKIQTLIEHCDRQEKFPLLLEKVEQKNPAKYERFIKWWAVKGEDVTI